MHFYRSLLAAALIATGAGALRADTAYAVDSRSLLISFDTQLPSFITGVRLIRGLQPGEGIVGIDFRPANKKLYGLGSSSRIYVIDPATGQATAVGTGPFTPALDGNEFGFDFNPTVDRIRVVSDKGQNLRLHPDTGMVAATDQPLNYADGSRPSVVASAYTNSFAGATSTLLYGLDTRGVLVTQNPPNDGRLNITGQLTNLNLSAVAGFDISPNDGAAYAAIRRTDSPAVVFYQIHLGTGDYCPLGELAIFEQISGLAVAPRP